MANETPPPPKPKPLAVATIRMPRELWVAIKLAAIADRKSANQYCVDALRAALAEDLEETSDAD